jgi:lipoprotein-anchoring transpeptidase ErfK/SrfK
MKARSATSRRVAAARVALISATVGAALCAPAVASANVPSSYPAAGTLRQESVAVYKRPDSHSRRMLIVQDTRTDGRPQVILAMAGRRIGFVAGATAHLTLKNDLGAEGLVLTGRHTGAAGNRLAVISVDELPGVSSESGLDYLSVWRGPTQLALVPYTSGNLGELAASVNSRSLPLLASAPGTGTLAFTGKTFLAGGKTAKPGVVWLKLNLPVRPLGQRGWIRASAAQIAPTRFHIVVNRSTHVLKLFKGSKRIFQTRVATGRPDRRTPRGTFYVAAKYVPHFNALVSGYALELSAPAGLPDFEFGGVIGIHGTPATSSLGHNASNGCIRVATWAVLHLRNVVPLGTPVHVID